MGVYIHKFFPSLHTLLLAIDGSYMYRSKHGMLQDLTGEALALHVTDGYHMGEHNNWYSKNSRNLERHFAKYCCLLGINLGIFRDTRNSYKPITKQFTKLACQVMDLFEKNKDNRDNLTTENYAKIPPNDRYCLRQLYRSALENIVPELSESEINFEVEAYCKRTLCPTAADIEEPFEFVSRLIENLNSDFILTPDQRQHLTSYVNAHIKNQLIKPLYNHLSSHLKSQGFRLRADYCNIFKGGPDTNIFELNRIKIIPPLTKAEVVVLKNEVEVYWGFLSNTLDDNKNPVYTHDQFQNALLEIEAKLRKVIELRYEKDVSNRDDFLKIIGSRKPPIYNEMMDMFYSAIRKTYDAMQAENS